MKQTIAEINFEKMVRNVAEVALDSYEYQGKTIRAWIKIIAEQEFILNKIRTALYEDYERCSASEVNLSFACGIKRAINTIDYYINHNLNGTNGDAISWVFPNAKIQKSDKEVFLCIGEKDENIQCFDIDWWDSPYQKGGKE